MKTSNQVQKLYLSSINKELPTEILDTICDIAIHNNVNVYELARAFLFKDIDGIAKTYCSVDYLENRELKLLAKIENPDTAIEALRDSYITYESIGREPVEDLAFLFENIPCCKPLQVMDFSIGDMRRRIVAFLQITDCPTHTFFPIHSEMDSASKSCLGLLGYLKKSAIIFLLNANITDTLLENIKKIDGNSLEKVFETILMKEQKVPLEFIETFLCRYVVLNNFSPEIASEIDSAFFKYITENEKALSSKIREFEGDPAYLNEISRIKIYTDDLDGYVSGLFDFLRQVNVERAEEITLMQERGENPHLHILPTDLGYESIAAFVGHIDFLRSLPDVFFQQNDDVIYTTLIAASKRPNFEVMEYLKDRFPAFFERFWGSPNSVLAILGNIVFSGGEEDVIRLHKLFFWDVVTRGLTEEFKTKLESSTNDEFLESVIAAREELPVFDKLIEFLVSKNSILGNVEFLIKIFNHSKTPENDFFITNRFFFYYTLGYISNNRECFSFFNRLLLNMKYDKGVFQSIFEQMLCASPITSRNQELMLMDLKEKIGFPYAFGITPKLHFMLENEFVCSGEVLFRYGRAIKLLYKSKVLSPEHIHQYYLSAMKLGVKANAYPFVRFLEEVIP